MKIELLNSALIKLSDTTNKNQEDMNYKDIILNFLQESKRADGDILSDKAIEEFKNDLSSMGALAFLTKLNMQKIEKKVEEYKQKLLDNDPSLSLKEVDSLVEEYRRELLEQMQYSLDASDDPKMAIQQTSAAYSLQKLLQNTF